MQLIVYLQAAMPSAQILVSVVNKKKVIFLAHRRKYLYYSSLW